MRALVVLLPLVAASCGTMLDTTLPPGTGGPLPGADASADVSANSEGGLPPPSAQDAGKDSNAGEDATTPVDCSSPTTFCDDFEQAPDAGYSTHISYGNAQVLRTSPIPDPPPAGSGGLFVSMTGDSGVGMDAWAHRKIAPALVVGTYAQRVRVRFTALPGSSVMSLVMFVGDKSTITDPHFLFGAAIQGDVWSLRRFRTGTAEVPAVLSRVRAVENRWTCVELVTTSTAQSSTIQLWVDGALAITAPAQLPLEGVPSFRLGIVGDTFVVGENVWFDDLVSKVFPGDTTARAVPWIGCN